MKFPRTGYPIFQLVPFDRFRSVTRDRSVRATLAKRRKREGEKESSDMELLGGRAPLKRNRKLADRAIPPSQFETP